MDQKKKEAVICQFVDETPKAMYDIANEENFINEVYKDMSLIKDLCGDSLDFKSLLSNSQINYQDKKNAILSLLENNNTITEKLIDLLIHNKRVPIIGDIAISFTQLYNKHNNIITTPNYELNI